MNFSKKNIRIIFVLLCTLIIFNTVSPTESKRNSKRTISIYNIHTKEKISVTYKRNNEYINSALKRINHIMRDWRRNESTKIDPKLIDLMWEIHTEVGSKRPIYLISGYRSSKTNNMLRKTRGGQARKSRHILGKAADVHFPDVSIKKLRNSALVRQRGGVGYYPTSALPFVHLDTGRVRHWPRMARYELAALFPSGRTRHIPRDGKRITKTDYRVAIARLKRRSNLRLAKAKKPTKTRTQLASLQAPVGLSPNRKVIPGKGKTKPVNKKPIFDKEGLLRLASIDPGKLNELNKNNIIKSDGPDITEGWVTAPAYDEEHPDELSYTPFPVLPLMRDKSVSYDTELASLQAPEHDKVVYLFGEPTRMIPLRFRQGLQFAEMLWASDFKGKAVINLISGAPQYPTHHLDALKKQQRQKGLASTY